MRVKLSYTVDEEDILPEAAKILGLSADDMKQAITLFQGVQNELSADADNVNTNRSLEMLEELRKALLAVDTRVTEVVDIIEGFEEYRAQQRAAAKVVVPAQTSSEE
jgi:threonine dehydrogenase-like Zn-dependent dehydrogenase